jgi:hypothetical protein
MLPILERNGGRYDVGELKQIRILSFKSLITACLPLEHA